MAAPNGPSPLPLAKPLPPELQASTTFDFSLKVLYERIIQDCFGNMHQNVGGLQQVPAARGPEGSKLAPEHYERRKSWMLFARYHREVFVKALVLTRWVQSGRDWSQLYALDEHLLQKLDNYNDAIWDFSDMRDRLTRIKIPSPDIETAVNILAQGELPKLSHLGVIRPARLTHAKLLEMVRRMNIVLHLRLNRDENLPLHLRNRFTIHDGRVTFTIEHEFALDLSLVSDNAAHPLVFLDLRFLFTPNIEIPHKFSTFLDKQVNAMLAQEGIAAAVDMLHEYVLTHKINLLRRQAVDLNQRSWAGSLRVEPMIHRALVIQYWQEHAGKKSWIEIGVNVGRALEKSSWKETTPPHLGVKWYRGGVLIPDASIDFPLGELRIETTLESVIALHTSWILSSVQAVGFGTIRAPSDVLTGHELVLNPPTGRNAERIGLQIEPRSGRFSLRPWCRSALRYESQINQLEKPEVEIPVRLRSFQSSLMRDRVERLGLEDGFTLARDVEWLAQPGERICIFEVPGWSGGWRLVWSLRDGEERWLVVQTEFSGQTMRRSRASVIPLATNARVERPKLMTAFAIHKITFRMLGQALQRKGLRYCQASAAGVRTGKVKVDVSNIIPKMAILIEMRGAAERATPIPATGPQPVVYLVHGRLDTPDEFKRILRDAPGGDFDIADSGAFTLRLEQELGSSAVVEDIVTRLRSIHRLWSLLRALDKAEIEPRSARSDGVEFAYCESDTRLTARVSFSLDSGEVRVRLLPKSNPHRRLASVWNKMFSRGSTMTNHLVPVFEDFIRKLRLTLPAMQALDRLEKNHSDAVLLNVMVQTTESLRCTYNTGHAFELLMRAQRNGTLVWSMSRVHVPGPRAGALSGVLRQALYELKMLLSESGEEGRWEGGSGQLVARLDAIQEPLERLDRAIRKIAVEGRRGSGGAAGLGHASQARAAGSGPAETSSREATAATVNGGPPATGPSRGAPTAKSEGRGGAGNQMKKVKEEQHDVVVLD